MGNREEDRNGLQEAGGQAERREPAEGGPSRLDRARKAAVRLRQRQRSLLLTGGGLLAALCVALGWSGLRGAAGSGAVPDAVTGQRQEAPASAASAQPAAPAAGSPGAAAQAPAAAAPQPAELASASGAAASAPAPTAAPARPASAAPASVPKLAAYQGPVEHIFFHPLIVYPERAFDGDRMAQGYDDWFVTVPEFKSILSDLYANGYVLADIRSLFEEDPAGPVPGGIRLKPLLFPEGKKPLIVSVDDLNYYTYMRENGNAFKLVLDGEGRPAAYSVDAEGRERVSRDDELVPIVDAFVEEHPDFSYQGAKGVLAVTGYEGVLGYRTDRTDAPDYEAVKADALKVIGRLKETGWSFASHSWGHPDAAKADLSRMEQDTARWKREVEPLVGPTPVFIYPYGSRLKHEDPKFRLLTDAGFRFFCGVGPSPYLAADGGYAEMDRRHVDGVALRTQQERLRPLFNAEKAFDSRRPSQ